MLRRPIKFTNFDDEEVEEIHYFNISKSQLLELQAEYQAGFGTIIQQIIDEKNFQELIKYFKKIVLLAYGKKEGNRFIQTDEVKEEFTQTAAYDALFMELATNAEEAAKFIRECLPKDMRGEFDKAAASTEALKAPTTT